MLIAMSFFLREFYLEISRNFSLEFVFNFNLIFCCLLFAVKSLQICVATLTRKTTLTMCLLAEGNCDSFLIGSEKNQFREKHLQTFQK